MKAVFDRILVVKNRALGDSVIGLGAVQYLRKIYPKATIHYALPSWIAPLYKNVVTDASSIIAIDYKGLRSIFSAFRLLWKGDYDLIIELHQSGSSGTFLKLFSLICRKKYFYHNHNLSANTGILDQGVEKPSIQRDLDGVWSHLVKIGDSSLKVPDYLEFRPELRFNEDVHARTRNRVIFGVVATRSTKMWPLRYYVEVARKLKEKKAGLEIVALLSSSKTDKTVGDQLERIDTDSVIDIETLPLSMLPKYFAESLCYIGNDTGLKHIAVASGIKTFTFFGPESPIEWHPYDDVKHRFFFLEDMPCRRAKSHFCGLDECSHHSCLEQIIPEAVVDAFIKEL